MNINRRTIIIVAVVTGILIFSILAIFLVKRYTTTKKKETAGKQWAVEQQDDLAKSAVEAYMLQDPLETKTSRTKRLQKYFSPNSPVYNYELNEFDNETTKITATVDELSPCEEQEGGNLCLVAKINTKYYSKENVSSMKQVYTLSIIKDEKGKFWVYDIGPMN